MEGKEIIVFSIANMEYGIDIKYVQGVEEWMEISPVAQAPHCIDGIVNLRGEIVPIFNLHGVFGLQGTERTNDTKIIFVIVDATPVGFVVDMVTGMKQVEKQEIRKVPKILRTKTTAYLDFIAQVESKLILVLEPKTLISQADQESIGELLKNKSV